MSNKPSYYGIMTAQVRYDKNLKPMEKILFVEISALLNMNGSCEASNNYFAELYEVSIETVSRWVSNLKKNGYISTQLIYKKNSKNIEKRVIRIIEKTYKDPIDKKVEPYCEKNQGGIDKKVKDINTPIGEIKYNIVPSDIISYYKKNISNLNEKIREQKAYSAMTLKSDDLYLIFKGLENYKEFVELKQVNTKYLKSLVSFIEDKVYLDFQDSKLSKQQKEFGGWSNYGNDVESTGLDGWK